MWVPEEICKRSAFGLDATIRVSHHWARLSSYKLLIPFRSLPPTCYILGTCPIASLLTLSYTFSKSIKPTLTSTFTIMLPHLTAFKGTYCLHMPSLIQNPFAYHQSDLQPLSNKSTYIFPTHTHTYIHTYTHKLTHTHTHKPTQIHT